MSSTSPAASASPPPAGVRHGPSYRADIEGLRGLAIVLVVIYHAGFATVSGGFIGVDVFFVLSGYLITGLLLKEILTSRTLSLGEFYARRCRRLLPASALTLACTVVASWFVYAPFEQREFASVALATALYGSNLWFAYKSTDYLAGDVSAHPLLHTWSLAVEEQFYLAWPLLVLVGARPGEDGRLRVRRLLAVLGTLMVASLALSIWLTATNQPWAFFGSPARAWEFCAGAFAAVAVDWRRLADRTATALGWIGLALVLGSSLWLNHSSLFPGWVAIPAVGGTALLLGIGSLDREPPFLRHPAMLWLGRHSYSWYLWHWPFMIIGEAALGVSGRGARSLLGLAALGVSAAALALVENPVRFHRRLAARPVLSLGLAGIVTASSAAGALSWRTRVGTESVADSQRAFTEARADSPGVYAAGCHAEFLRTNLGDCTFGVRDGRRTVMLVGDSHAAQWFPALEAVALQRGWRLVSLTKSGCPAADVEVRADRFKRIYHECTEWRQRVFQRIAREKPDVVVYGSSSRYLEPSGASTAVVDAERWRAGTARAIEAAHAAGAKVLVLKDSPWPGFDVPRCLGRAAWHTGGTPERACEFVIGDEASRLASDGERAAMTQQHAYYGDLSAEICPVMPCVPIQAGAIVFRDEHHLTTAFSRRLAPVFDAMIERLSPSASPSQPVDQQQRP